MLTVGQSTLALRLLCPVSGRIASIIPVLKSPAGMDRGELETIPGSPDLEEEALPPCRLQTARNITDTPLTDSLM